MRALVNPVHFLVSSLFPHLSRFSSFEMESSSMASSEDDESIEAQGFAMDIDGEGAVDNGCNADEDEPDIGGDPLGVDEDETEDSEDVCVTPVVRWIVDNYKQPDARRVMIMTLLFVLGCD